MGILSRKTLLLRMVMMLIALLGSMLLVECTGSAGKIYGQFYYDGYLVANFGLGGFPSGTIYTDTNYQIQPGTYTVTYTLEDGSGYYYPAVYASSYCASTPGDSSCATYYYDDSYTCSANPGKPFWAAGDDKYFTLHLSYSGLATSGSLNVEGAPSGPKLGTSTYSDNGLLITVTTKIAQLTPGQTIHGDNTVGKSK